MQARFRRLALPRAHAARCLPAQGSSGPCIALIACAAARPPLPSPPGLQVCAISGRCFATLLTEREEHAGEEERGQTRSELAAADDGWGDDDGVSGRLGRAFNAGYSCETDADFYRRFGSDPC